jgi:hypothetical protein
VGVGAGAEPPEPGVTSMMSGWSVSCTFTSSPVAVWIALVPFSGS